MEYREVKCILREIDVSIENMIDNKINDFVDKEIPHVRYPATLYARITGKKDDIYSLRILTETMGVDEYYPEIPNVKSGLELGIEDVVVVTFLYGKMGYLYILGKVI